MAKNIVRGYIVSAITNPVNQILAWKHHLASLALYCTQSEDYAHHCWWALLKGEYLFKRQKPSDKTSDGFCLIKVFEES